MAVSINWGSFKRGFDWDPETDWATETKVSRSKGHGSFIRTSTGAKYNLYVATLHQYDPIYYSILNIDSGSSGEFLKLRGPNIDPKILSRDGRRKFAAGNPKDAVTFFRNAKLSACRLICYTLKGSRLRGG